MHDPGHGAGVGDDDRDGEQRLPVARHCNSDAFWISETDSETNRESITILLLS